MNLISRVKEDADKALREIYLKEQDFCLKWLRKNTTLSDADNVEIFQSAVIILYDNIMTGKLTELTS